VHVLRHRRQKEKLNKQSEWDWKGTGSDMSNAKYCILAAMLAVQAAGSAVLADNTYTSQINTDTYLDSASPTANFGLASTDKVVINSTSRCRALFDLPTDLWSYSPSEIISVSVTFYVWQDNTQTYNVSLFPLTRAFGVGTWNGKGTPPAQANGATWNTYDGTNSWTTAGGDFDSANSVLGVKETLGVNPGEPSGRFFTWDITSLLANPTTRAELQNFGAMLRVDETIPPSGQRYAAYTSADNTNYTTAYRPFVEVTVVSDSSLPVITGVQSTGATQMKATVQWTTDLSTSSKVLFWTSGSSVTNLASVAGNTTSHSVRLNALAPGTVYYYEVVSASSTNNNQGAYYTFTTTTPCPCQ
jgi:hypothetical protein